ncbi:MAG: cell division protein ZapA [Eubacterium sp.]|nr:cell division protein ZapA [Eubacterium sp.]
MSNKTSVEVLIGGKIYELAGFESEEYLQRVASFINSKISELDEVEANRRMPADMKAVLIELNLADSYFKTKKTADNLDVDLQEKEKELYDLRHDMVTIQMKTESLEKTIARLQEDNKELTIENARLLERVESANASGKDEDSGSSSGSKKGKKK